jgi:hypothetical protein
MPKGYFRNYFYYTYFLAIIGVVASVVIIAVGFVITGVYWQFSRLRVRHVHYSALICLFFDSVSA